ncbi:hypothetical protein ACWGMK_01440 [Agrobacterium deltaense]
MEKIIFLATVAGIAVYFGLNMNTQKDTTLFPYTREQITAILTQARTVIPRRDGDGNIQIWGAGRSADGIKLNMRYADNAPLLECMAVVTEVTAEQSRVVAECGSPANAKSAISQTQKALQVPMFEEHIQSTLDKRSFDRTRVDQKESALVLQNMGGMQMETLKRQQEIHQEIRKIEQQQQQNQRGR